MVNIIRQEVNDGKRRKIFGRDRTLGIGQFFAN